MIVGDSMKFITVVYLIPLDFEKLKKTKKYAFVTNFAQGIDSGANIIKLEEIFFFLISFFIQSRRVEKRGIYVVVLGL